MRGKYVEFSKVMEWNLLVVDLVAEHRSGRVFATDVSLNVKYDRIYLLGSVIRKKT